MARKALEYALRVSDDVTALHVTTLKGEDLDEQAQGFRQLVPSDPKEGLAEEE